MARIGKNLFLWNGIFWCVFSLWGVAMGEEDYSLRLTTDNWAQNRRELVGVHLWLARKIHEYDEQVPVSLFLHQKNLEVAKGLMPQLDLFAGEQKLEGVVYLTPLLEPVTGTYPKMNLPQVNCVGRLGEKNQASVPYLTTKFTGTAAAFSPGENIVADVGRPWWGASFSENVAASMGWLAAVQEWVAQQGKVAPSVHLQLHLPQGQDLAQAMQLYQMTLLPQVTVEVFDKDKMSLEEQQELIQKSRLPLLVSGPLSATLAIANERAFIYFGQHDENNFYTPWEQGLLQQQWSKVQAQQTFVRDNQRPTEQMLRQQVREFIHNYLKQEKTIKSYPEVGEFVRQYQSQCQQRPWDVEYIGTESLENFYWWLKSLGDGEVFNNFKKGQWRQQFLQQQQLWQMVRERELQLLQSPQLQVKLVHYLQILKNQWHVSQWRQMLCKENGDGHKAKTPSAGD